MDPLAESGLVEEVTVERAPDHLLRVEDPAGARAALDAAERTVLVDGRATAWIVASRLATGAFYVALCAAVVRDVSLHEPWTFVPTWLVLAMLAPVLVLQLFSARVVGLSPRAGARWARWAGPVSWTVLVVGFLVVRFDASWFVGLLAAGVLVGSAAPVVQWRRAVRRAATSERRWPAGAEAYAVLSVLAQARWVHPDRLPALTGLLPVRCDEWVTACAARGLVVPGTRRVVFARGAEITARGRERLEEWTAELEARAAGAQPWTASTAPTSPAVSSPRSSSDVT